MEEPSPPASAAGPSIGRAAAQHPDSSPKVGASAPAGSREPAPPPSEHHSSLGEQFESLIRQACPDRLGPVRWFRTDWQRGGAMTGYSTFRADDQTPHPAVIKLPVPPGERRWLEALQPHDGVVPRLYAHGQELGGYDMAWIVMEHVPHGPLGGSWNGREFDLLVEAAGRFYAAARDVPLAGHLPLKDWDAIFHRARENVHIHEVAFEQRWNAALKKAHRKLHDWVAIWRDKPVDHWCHGDLHLGNTLTRCEPPGGPAVLIDFAETHPGNWVEDAVYFEHLYWARRERLGGRKVCSLIARERRKHGLPVEDDWPRLASVRRALIALSTPAMLQHDGDPHHVKACLEVLEMESH